MWGKIKGSVVAKIDDHWGRNKILGNICTHLDYRCSSVSCLLWRTDREWKSASDLVSCGTEACLSEFQLVNNWMRCVICAWCDRLSPHVLFIFHASNFLNTRLDDTKEDTTMAQSQTAMKEMKKTTTVIYLWHVAEHSSFYLLHPVFTPFYDLCLKYILENKNINYVKECCS